MGDNDVGISVQKLTAPKQLSAWCIEKAPLDHNELTVHTLSNKSTYCPKLYDIFSIATGITISTVHHPARVTVVNLAKMAETVAPLRERLGDLMSFLHRICRQYFVCQFLASLKF